MQTKPRTWKSWLLISCIGLAIFTTLAFFFASAQYLDSAYRDNASWSRSVRFSLAEWWPWAILAPLILWGSWRFTFQKGRRFKSVLAHGPACLLVVFIKQLTQSAVIPLLIPSYRFVFNLNTSGILSSLLMYWLIFSVALGLEWQRRSRDRERRNSQLETQLAQAQLHVLKMQLHPHFLFNTLHAISTLMHRDVEAADRMMSRLSDLLRLSLEQFGVQKTSLRQELDFLRRYLEIEQIRFGERLDVTLDIEPQALDATVPSFILQPLVENAVRHGISPRARGGTIILRAERDNGHLSLEVQDDGVGRSHETTTPRREGVGLSNTRARLLQLYGDEAALDLVDPEAGGLTVSLTIPYQNGEALDEAE
jgi:sensor histidine kinase YesM